MPLSNSPSGSRESTDISDLMRDTLSNSLLPTETPIPQHSQPNPPPSRRLSKSKPEEFKSKLGTQDDEALDELSMLLEREETASSIRPKQEQELELLSANAGSSFNPTPTPSGLPPKHNATNSPKVHVKANDFVLATPSQPDSSQSTQDCKRQLFCDAENFNREARKSQHDICTRTSDDGDFMDRSYSRNILRSPRHQTPIKLDPDLVEDRIEPSPIEKVKARASPSRHPPIPKRQRTPETSPTQERSRDPAAHTLLPLASKGSQGERETTQESELGSQPDAERVRRILAPKRRRLPFKQALSLGSRNEDARSSDTALAARVCALGDVALQVAAFVFYARVQSGTSKNALRSREGCGWVSVRSLETRLRDAEAGEVQDAVERLIEAQVFETCTAAASRDLLGTAGALVALLQRTPLDALCKLVPGGDRVVPRNKPELATAICKHLGMRGVRRASAPAPICSQPPPFVNIAHRRKLVQTTVTDEPHGERVAKEVLAQVGLCVRFVRCVLESLLRLHVVAETNRD